MDYATLKSQQYDYQLQLSNQQKVVDNWNNIVKKYQETYDKSPMECTLIQLSQAKESLGSAKDILSSIEEKLTDVNIQLTTLLNENTPDEEKKVETNVVDLSTQDESSSVESTTGQAAISGSNTIMKMGDNILNGAKYKKYDDPQKLEGIQMEPSWYNNPNGMKTINAKQDYVVIIRKKLFYAATAMGASTSKVLGEKRINKKTGKEEDTDYSQTGGDENYLRVYQINNFTNIKVSSNVYGRPGSCSISLKGAERVICSEKYEQNDFNWQNWQEFLNGWTSVDEQGAEAIRKTTIKSTSTDENGDTIVDTTVITKMGRNEQTISTDEQTITGSEEIKTKSKLSENETIYAGDGSDTIDGTCDYVSLDSVRTDKYAWRIGESDWALKDASGIDFKNLLKAREAKYGWKFAEKCDWMPMDEVYIFGKSLTERVDDTWIDSPTGNGKIKVQGTGAFKMNPLFFGYIDGVNKTYQAGKGGLLMHIQATDHLKLLDISYVTNHPTLTPGISNGGSIDIRYSTDSFGAFLIHEPYRNASKQTDADAEGKARNKYDIQAYLGLENVFGGKPPYEIINALCIDAGIPTKYLRNRIEKIKQAPFVFKVKQSTSGDLFNADLKKRSDICKMAAEKLFLEFFADEAGNIVFKIPNYALGCNKLKANNMDREDIPDNLLDQVGFKVTDVDGSGQTTDTTTSSTITDDLNKKLLEEKDKLTSLNIKLNNLKNKTQTGNSTTEAYNRVYSAIDSAKQSDMLSEGKAKAITHTIDNYKKDTSLSLSDVKEKLTQYLAKYSISVNFSDLIDEKTSTSSDTVESVQKEIETEQKTIDALQNQINQQSSSTTSTQSTTSDTSKDDFDKNGQGAYIIKDGDTLWTIAETYFDDGTQWNKIYNDNRDIIGDDPNTLIPGTQIMIYSSSKSPSTVNDAKQKIANKPVDNTTKTKVKTLAELTDDKIPEIKPEYIISFTITDQDREVYNVFEINMEQNMIQTSGPIAIRRAVPDLDSIIQFGTRPHPAVINTPLIGSTLEAEIFGFMMIARSLANRITATLTMIEDSSIKVGNPVRFFVYDQHPGKNVSQSNTSNNPYSNLVGQAVFYVAAIDRSISVNGTSHMNLQLKAGRMVYAQSIYDISLPLYNTYYDTKLSSKLNSYVEPTSTTTSTNTDSTYSSYEVKDSDSITNIVNDNYDSNTDSNKVISKIIELNPDKFNGVDASDYNNIDQKLHAGTSSIKLPNKNSL